MKKTLATIALAGIGLLGSGCEKQEFKGTYTGVRYDGDGGGKIFVSGQKYNIGAINPDTLAKNQEYTFELTDSPFGDYISDVKTSN